MAYDDTAMTSVVEQGLRLGRETIINCQCFTAEIEARAKRHGISPAACSGVELESLLEQETRRAKLFQASANMILITASFEVLLIFGQDQDFSRSASRTSLANFRTDLYKEPQGRDSAYN